MKRIFFGIAAMMLAVACGGSEDGQAEGGAGGGAGSPGTGGGAGNDEGTPSGGSIIDEAIATCAWTTACLATQGMGQDAAPARSVTACLRMHLHARTDDVGGIAREPWAEFRACTATATTCESFTSCLEASQTICERSGEPGKWGKSGECPDGSRTCDGACLPSCNDAGTKCSADKSRLTMCANGTEYSVGCDVGAPGGSCVETTIGSTTTATCVAGTTGTCSANGASCDGSISVRCYGGVEYRVDCAIAGRVCESGICEDGTACAVDGSDKCNGDKLSVCLSGNPHEVDCAAFGGTCGELATGHSGCVLP